MNPTPPPLIRLACCLTAEQFAFLTQFNTEVIRRKVRGRVIKGFGNPIRIPPRELLHFGVSLEDAALALHEWVASPSRRRR